MSMKSSPNDLYDITCAVCLDIFHDQRELPCRHVFCYKCIAAFFEAGGGEALVCPLCRHSTPLDVSGIAGLKPNPALLRMVRILEDEKCDVGDAKGVVDESCEKGWYKYKLNGSETMMGLALSHGTTKENIMRANRLIVGDLDLLPGESYLYLPLVAGAIPTSSSIPEEMPLKFRLDILATAFRSAAHNLGYSVSKQEIDAYLHMHDYHFRKAFQTFKEDKVWEKTSNVALKRCVSSSSNTLAFGGEKAKSSFIWRSVKEMLAISDEEEPIRYDDGWEIVNYPNISGKKKLGR